MGGSNTYIDYCEPTMDAVPHGWYITATCQEGGPSRLGNNTQISQCSEAPSGYYIKELCKVGASSYVGTDSVILPCSNKALKDDEEKYVSHVCTSGWAPLLKVGQDTQFMSCYNITTCIHGNSTEKGFPGSMPIPAPLPSTTV